MKKRLLLLCSLIVAMTTGAFAQEEEDMQSVPLTLEAIEDGTITFRNAAANSVTYRINDGEELQTAKRNGKYAYSTQIQVKAGDKVTFICPKGGNWIGGANSSYTYKYTENYSTKYTNSNIYCSSDCYVYGNIMSLLTPTFETASTTKAEYSWTSYTFYLFFSNNPHLLSHPTKDLVMPAMELTENCYRQMFQSCKGLTRAPALPATQLAYQCYYQMFINCTGLTETPVLPGTTLGYQSYYEMFSGCTNLNRVTCYANPRPDYMTNWLKNVAAEGTFVKAAGSIWGEGTNAIPAGWTVEEKTVPYAYYNTESKTLYFRCDENRPTSYAYPVENTGRMSPGWFNYRSDIESIVFEESFQAARPVSCFKWFQGMSNVTSVTGWEYFNPSEVTTMQYMFAETGDDFNIDFSHFDTGKVKSLVYMFYNTTRTGIDFTGFKTDNVEDFSSMFYGASKLQSLDLSSFNTSKATNVISMFWNCFQLKSLNITSFDTSNLTSLYGMFYNCYALEDVDLRNFDTRNVTIMEDMFYNCQSLKTLDLSSFDTGKVTTFMEMFRGCSSLTLLDLTNFRTVGTPVFAYMFAYCGNLQAIFVDDAIWTVLDPNLSTNSMFENCYSLVGEDGTHVGSVVDGTYAHTGTGGYLTRKFRTISAQEMNGSFWTTYYKSNVNRVADENTKVFQTTLRGDKLILHEVEDKNIKAGQGVVLKSTSETITLANTVQEPTADFSENCLTGTDVAISNPDYATTYVLSNAETGLGFYHLNSPDVIEGTTAFFSYTESEAPEFFLLEEETEPVVEPTIHETEYEVACDYFNWHGKTYTASCTDTYEERNEDDVVTDIYSLDLTIHYSTTGLLHEDLYVGDHYKDAKKQFDFTVELDGQTEYQYFTANEAGCDSIITLGITIHEAEVFPTEEKTIEQGESYEWRGRLYTESGVYKDTVFTQYGGAKEVYVLELTVKESSGIRDVASDKWKVAGDAMYDLQGRKVGQRSEVRSKISGLKSGFYIVNGKKVLVDDKQ